MQHFVVDIQNTGVAWVGELRVLSNIKTEKPDSKFEEPILYTCWSPGASWFPLSPSFFGIPTRAKSCQPLLYKLSTSFHIFCLGPSAIIWGTVVAVSWIYLQAPLVFIMIQINWSFIKSWIPYSTSWLNTSAGFLLHMDKIQTLHVTCKVQFELVLAPPYICCPSACQWSALATLTCLLLMPAPACQLPFPLAGTLLRRCTTLASDFGSHVTPSRRISRSPV